MPGPKIVAPKKPYLPRSKGRPAGIKFRQRSTRDISPNKGQFQEFQKWEKFKSATPQPGRQFRNIARPLSMFQNQASMENSAVSKPEPGPIESAARGTFNPVLSTYWSGIPLHLLLGPLFVVASAWLTGGGKGGGKPGKIDKILEQAPEAYASQLHNAWRQGRALVPGAKAADGTPMREPRWKAVEKKDPSYRQAPKAFRRTVEKDGNTTYEVDIANLEFRRLPEKFKYENMEAAKGVMGILKKTMMEQTSKNKIIVNLENASDVVHQQWLGRNGSWAPEEQKLPYEKLSEIEKEKDRDILLEGIYFLNEKLKDEGITLTTSDYEYALKKEQNYPLPSLQEFHASRKILAQTGISPLMEKIHYEVFIKPGEAPEKEFALNKFEPHGMPNFEKLREMLVKGELSHLPVPEKIKINLEISQLEEYLKIETINSSSNKWEALMLLSSGDWILRENLLLESGPQPGWIKFMKKQQKYLLASIEAALLRDKKIDIEDVHSAVFFPYLIWEKI